MESEGNRESVRWFSRTIQPPGNTAALRRAVAAYPHGVMLESVALDGSSGRYSIFGLDPVRVLTVTGAAEADPFAQLSEFCRPWLRLEPDPSLPFVGGWIGYLAYEAGRFVEPSAGWVHDCRELPLSYWALYDTVLVHDGLTDRWSVAGVALPPRLAGGGRPPVFTRLDGLERLVTDELSATSYPLTAKEPVSLLKSHRALPAGMGRWNYSREAYLAKVERALEYIRAGDIFQVNLARRCHAYVTVYPIELYQRLCEANPAAYAAYLQIPGFSVAVLSSSPELFLRVRGRDVTTRPIKGTRPRGKTPASDAAARQALAESRKDRAELNMIVDLERNDLGRACGFGTIRVVHDGEIETLPTVFHRTATVIGRLRDDADAIDLLRGMFPGGSVTGAPKVRAMQIINELEPDPRGPYCGAIGYVSLDGDMQLNLPIRTMTAVVEDSRIQGFKDSRIRGDAGVGALESLNPRPPKCSVMLHVGSGIVADSDPEDEYAELRAKAAGMMRALSHELSAKEPPTLVVGRPCGQ